MKHKSSKTYGNDRGISCCFRQWRATHSHCQYLHGYAIGVHLEFGANVLDEKNWVYDFGKCKWIKDFLEKNFDHKTVIAEDDPKKVFFYDLEKAGLIQLNIIPNVGCEAFAKYIFDYVAPLVYGETNARVRLLSVKVFEHEGNSATYEEL